jgi:hypothetical protein
MAISTRKQTGAGYVADMPSVTLSEGKLSDQQAAYLTDAIRGLIRAYNGGISFGDGSNSSQLGNIDGHTKEVYFAVANTDVEVPINLGGRVPIGVITLDVNVDGAVVRGNQRGDWNASRVFLRCSQAGTTALLGVV